MSVRVCDNAHLGHLRSVADSALELCNPKLNRGISLGWWWFVTSEMSKLEAARSHPMFAQETAIEGKNALDSIVAAGCMLVGNENYERARSACCVM